MLRVTADIFSGRPNPTWDIQDEAEARAVLKDIASNRRIATEVGGAAESSLGLGFRGLIVEPMADDLGKDFGLEGGYRVSPSQVGGDSKGSELIEKLIDLAGKSPSVEGLEDAEDQGASLRELLRDQLDKGSRTTVPDQRGDQGNRGTASHHEGTEEAAPEITCYIEKSPYNPGFWNNDSTTLRNNNCYNYASNKKTNTFAQPGRGAGSMYTALTCPEVTRASLADGLHHRYNCFPDSQKPRYLVALVIAPGPSFKDFHWYRLNSENFWSHKPGGTPARNVDNSNKVITNPETCNRGPYTNFCGYFYTCKSQKIK